MAAWAHTTGGLLNFNLWVSWGSCLKLLNAEGLDGLTRFAKDQLSAFSSGYWAPACAAFDTACFNPLCDAL